MKVFVSHASADANLAMAVRDLLQLEPGVIVESDSANGADVPLIANAQLIGWAEFEVAGQKLAVRITGIK